MHEQLIIDLGASIVRFNQSENSISTISTNESAPLSLEDAFWLQLAGFIMIVMGNLLYCDAITVPSIRKMWKKQSYHEITSK